MTNNEELTCKNMLKKALSADENGDKDKAIEYYSASVELILNISDKEKREKLNKFALQALERAETLKGIKRDSLAGKAETNKLSTSSQVPGQSPNTSRSPLSSHNPKLKLTTASGYSAEEKRVLEHTSHINSKVYVPFMDIDLMERFNLPIPFTDKVTI
jgi:calpain-7